MNIISKIFLFIQQCKIAWIILFLISWYIGYVIHRNWDNRMYIITLMNDHKKSRINFLNNTFCGKFISNTWQATINTSEIEEHNRLLQLRITRSDIEHENLSCTEFIKNNSFYSKHITNLEYSNPIAFTILVYKKAYHFRVLMGTLYTRSNFHCIHVDEKAPINMYTYALKLSTCLDNVYVITPRISLLWGKMSILEMERRCQTYLLNRSSQWNYYMTIAGTELPIQTNLNRIQILQLAPDRSRSDVSSYPQPDNHRQTSKKPPPLANMTIYKGEFHSILSREFIQAVHTNPLALELWSFLNGTLVPDEHFYPTLIRWSELPGGKTRATSTYTHDDLLSHYKIWLDKFYERCQSARFYNGVCQFNYKDLAKIEQSGRLFANKFNQDFDLVSIDCWEEWLGIKQVHHQDIDPQNYINKFPFTRRKEHISNSSSTLINRN